jgi:hypothetical protein
MQALIMSGYLSEKTHLIISDVQRFYSLNLQSFVTCRLAYHHTSLITDVLDNVTFIIFRELHTIVKQKKRTVFSFLIYRGRRISSLLLICEFPVANCEAHFYDFFSKQFHEYSRFRSHPHVKIYRFPIIYLTQ